MTQESIIDTTRPNAGRIYDYVLGGHHNFDVDRQAAEHLIKLIPYLPKAMRMQRWCLQDLAVELTEQRGFDVIIDLASGLPTNDHLHHVVPPGTVVIYSDWDPVVVEYAHEILEGVPNVHYFQADLRQPEHLLNRPEVQAVLQGRRAVALVCWGVSIFLTDEELAQAAQALYRWAGPGSCWAFEAQGAISAPDDPMLARMLETYKQAGTALYLRPLERFQQLVRPWRADSQGFVSFLDWHGFDQGQMTEDELRLAGPGGGNYGAYLIK
jgi:hypothetical protein